MTAHIVTVSKRILVIAADGRERTQGDFEARLPGAPRSVVRAALADLCNRGRLRRHAICGHTICYRAPEPAEMRE